MKFQKLMLSVAFIGVMAVGVMSVSAQTDESENRSQAGIVGTIMGIVVDETGLEPREIIQQMRDDATLAEIITASGGSVDVVIDASVTAITERVNERVADGNLTQAEADRFLGRLEERVTDGLNGEGMLRQLVERRLRKGVLDLAAEQTGLTREEIVTQVQAGATLGDILSANGVDVDTFIDSAVAQVAEHLPDRLPEERAEARLDQLRERLTARITGAQ